MSFSVQNTERSPRNNVDASSGKRDMISLLIGCLGMTIKKLTKDYKTRCNELELKCGFRSTEKEKDHASFKSRGHWNFCSEKEQNHVASYSQSRRNFFVYGGVRHYRERNVKLVKR
jgi:hypothetical protein